MENIDLIFLFVIAAFIGYYFCKKEKFDSVEEFSAINDARQAVREVYNADVDAIRNLSDVAKKLQAGGLTVPGNLHAHGVLSTGDHVNTPALRRVGGDWLRINQNGNGRVALYGNLSINDTIGGNSGLAVGDWKYDVGQGNILATSNIRSKGTMTADGSMSVGGNLDVSGRLNLSNGWNIRTNDGHLRFYHNEDHQMVIHNPHAGAEWANVVQGKRLRGEQGSKINGPLIVNGRDILTELDQRIRADDKSTYYIRSNTNNLLSDSRVHGIFTSYNHPHSTKMRFIKA